MAARTGREFLAGLRRPREIWVGDDKVTDIVVASGVRGRGANAGADLRPAASGGATSA